jgi:chromosome segregation ATPase
VEGDLVRLQTEVTVARAELDGAYGTRAQRAAESANHPNHAELQARVEKLQSELTEMIAEYEAMTKQSIEFEKEREALEKDIDGLRDRCEALETQLCDEKVRWMGAGAKSPAMGGMSPGMGPSSGNGDMPPQTTSATVLRNEFKKMMRDTRAENAKLLRVSFSALGKVWKD